MSDQQEPIIQVRGLTKTFGENTVLNDLSFSVYQGETVVFLGRSGTGKSVTLKSIIGLMNPSAGQVNIFDTNIHKLKEKDRLEFRKQIGYVFQGAALFDSLTVLENVGFPLFQEGKMPENIIRQQVHDRLQMVGLAHTIDAYPSSLSGGMQKRVGLARALINLPKLILYDEPTSGLDPLTTDVINQIILRLRSKLQVTSIVVTHDMSSAFTIADRIIMLDQGRIVCQGTPLDIQQSENPWVQHFISGHALESERIDSGLMSSVRVSAERSTSQNRRKSASGAFPATTTAERQRTSGLLPAVRTRRRTTDGGGSSQKELEENEPSKVTKQQNHIADIDLDDMDDES